MSDASIDGKTYLGESNGLPLLNYEKNVLIKTLPASTLFIVASGLGIERLFLEHLILFSDRRLLTIVLNTTPNEEVFFISQLKDANADCEPKVINADVSTVDRESIYLEGGVQFCSTRVVLVDMLQNRIPFNRIAAILVYRAHQSLNAFQESFVLRLYREKKPTGMVKAFSDNPNVISPLGQLQRLIDRLYVRHVELLPRFSLTIEEELSRTQMSSSIFSVDVTLSMRRIQRTLVDFIKVCVRDLRTSSIASKQEGEQYEEMVHVPWYPTQLEKRLKYRRGHITEKQSRLLNDTTSLRELLQMSENLDTATLLGILKNMRADKEIMERHSGWLISPSFNRIITELNNICGITNDKVDIKKFKTPAKWNVLADVLEEIKQIPLDKKEYTDQSPCVVVVTDSEDVSRQLSDVIRYGIQKTKWMSVKQLDSFVKDACPIDEPLWLPHNVSFYRSSDIDSETKDELISNVQKNQKTEARAAKKRRKAAEQLSENLKSSEIQTSIVQFGILEYKRRRTCDKPSTSSEDVVKEEVEEAEELAKTINDIENVELLIITVYNHNPYKFLKMLADRNPVVIVLYTMSLATLRQIELYRACHPEKFLQVYCLQYRESTEESRYLESINRETLSFESLIREQGTLLIQREFNVEREDPPRIKTSTRQGGGDREESDERPKIIVDMREFNSELPTILYTKGYDVVAATIEIGDYILSPIIAIERKALDDLTQSLQSGRVFKQIDQMIAHYDCSVLLIESNTKFEKKIVNGGPFQGELSRHCREIRSRFCSLIRAQPLMKCMWSLSPSNSAEMYTELKLNSKEPDVEKAVSLKSDQIVATENQDQTKKGKKQKPNSTILRTLTNHCNIKSTEAIKLMTNSPINNLAQLFTTDLSSDTVRPYLTDSFYSFLENVSSFDYRNKL